jgi:hypothetical protein
MVERMAKRACIGSWLSAGGECQATAFLQRVLVLGTVLFPARLVLLLALFAWHLQATVVREGKAARVKTRTEARPFAPHVTSLHPSGDLAAFSVNWFGQFMRGTGTETREVVDLDSDLAIVDFRTGDVSTSPGIADPDRLETFPSWSPDGKHLFFSSVPRLWKKTAFAPLKDYKQVQAR